MPFYEYRCQECGHELEVLQKISDPPPGSCPACGAQALVKKVSVAGFQLKGTGWYATDFRNPKPPVSSSTNSDGGEYHPPSEADPPAQQPGGTASAESVKPNASGPTSPETAKAPANPTGNAAAPNKPSSTPSTG